MQKTIVILGPTCSWKSEVAMRFAEAHGGEIISCDSMQIYRGLPIGTAQPSQEDMRRVPHHLIGCLDIGENYDANIFVDLAQKAIADVQSRGRLPVMAGGTGLYARTLIYGHSLLPADRAVSQRLKEDLGCEGGLEVLMGRLAAAAGGIDKVPQDIRQNPRHLLRSCEVLELTGKLSWQMNAGNDQPSPEFRQFIILPELNMLKVRIRRRTRRMLDQGWLQEAQQAIGRGLMETPTARQALGYRDIAQFLEGNGPADENTLCDALANRTIQYARRQLTWFKHQHPGACMLPVACEDGAVEGILVRIERECGF